MQLGDVISALLLGMGIYGALYAGISETYLKKLEKNNTEKIRKELIRELYTAGTKNIISIKSTDYEIETYATKINQISTLWKDLGKDYNHKIIFWGLIAGLAVGGGFLCANIYEGQSGLVLISNIAIILGIGSIMVIIKKYIFPISQLAEIVKKQERGVPLTSLVEEYTEFKKYDL